MSAGQSPSTAQAGASDQQSTRSIDGNVPGQHAASALTDAAPVSPLQVEIAQARAWKLLNEAFKSKKTSERVDSLSALSTIPGNIRALNLVESALSDQEPEVRAQAASVLAQLNAQQAIPKMRPLLKDKSPEVSFAAARALSQLGDQSGRDILVEVLTGERRINGGVLDSGKDWAKQFTIKDVAFLGAAEGASVFAGPFGTIGVSAIRQLFFQDHTGTARATSAQVLSQDGSARVIEILENALGDKDWTVRFSAANALGYAPSTQPIGHLQKLLQDKKFPVRLVSAAAIVRLAAPQPPSYQHVDLSQPSATQ